jgi:hypothetical protein
LISVLIRRATVAACAIAFLACACSSSGNKAAPPTTTKAKPPTTKPRSTTTRAATGTTVPSTAGTGTGTTIAPTTTVPSAKVADLILNDAGPGFLLQPDSIADTGPTKIGKAADDDVSPNARAALVDTQFQDGYQRQWINNAADGTNNNDFIFLYQFATPGGAQIWAQHWRQTLENTPHQGASLTSFSPSEIPGAMGLSSANKTSGSTGVVIFSKGNYAVQVIVNSVNVNGGDSPDQSGAATALGVEQYQRLP